jgi:DNA/RNA endonuclease YhcR with UshA esterase domain
MKHLFTIIAAFFFISLASAQTITSAEAKNYEGKTVTVCGKVASTVVTVSKTILVYFDQPAPNNTFEVHIFNVDISKFSYNPAEFLKGKTVCVNGTISMFKGKPEIRVRSESDITIK